MGTAQRPSLTDLNTARLIAESVPAQIRVVQQKLRELEASRTRYRAELDILVETAILHGVELCPAETGNAAGPGGADGAVRGWF